MRHLHLLLLGLIARLHVALLAPPRPRSSHGRDDRGDVPGWVMITVMSAGLVVAIGAVAREQLGEMLSAALDSVR